MNDNAREPAFGYSVPENYNNYHHGLTKREYASIAAMQGLLANHTFMDRYIPKHDECDQLAKTAINYADALMKELDSE